MDNAHRPAGSIGMIMGEGQGVGRFNTQFEDDLNRDALIRCIQGSAQARDGVSIHVLEYEVVNPGILEEFMGAHNIGMMKTRHDSGLIGEAHRGALILFFDLSKTLDDDVHPIIESAAEKHLAHAANPQTIEHFISVTNNPHALLPSPDMSPGHTIHLVVRPERGELPVLNTLEMPVVPTSHRSGTHLPSQGGYIRTSPCQLWRVPAESGPLRDQV